MEILFLLVWRMRQDIEFQKTRVLVQALMSQKGAEGKQIEQAFAELREACFPFDKNQKEAEIDRLKKAMHREIARGPLVIQPQIDLTRAAMKQKLSQGREALEARKHLQQQGRLTRLDTTPPGSPASSIGIGAAMPPARPSPFAPANPVSSSSLSSALRPRVADRSRHRRRK